MEVQNIRLSKVSYEKTNTVQLHLSALYRLTGQGREIEDASKR